MARFVVLLVLSVCSCVPFVAVSPRASSQRNAGVAIDQLICKLDPKVNATSFSNFSTEIQQLWEPFCGANRGIFVVEPADGQTYNCGKLPASWGIKTVADIVNLTPAKGTEVLSSYLGAVFNSSIVKTADTCDFQSLGRLHCGEEREKPWQRAPWAAKVGNKPLRGVNMGGLFVLEPWITPDFTSWDDDVRDQYTFSQTAGATATLKAHWSSWYTQADFDAMASHGLNVVRIPIGWWYFAEDAGLSSAPYIIPAERTSDSAHPITSVIKMAQKAGLSVIIDLHGAPSSQNGLDNSGQRSMDPQIEDWGDSWLYNATAKDDTTEVLVAIVKYVSGLKASGVDNVIALELLNEPWVFGDMSRVRDFYEDAITALRKVDAELPLIIHDAFRHEEWAWLLHDWGFENVFMDTHVYHAFNIADYASSTAACDKSKIVAHENMVRVLQSTPSDPSGVPLLVHASLQDLRLPSCPCRRILSRHRQLHEVPPGLDEEGKPV